MAEFWHLEEGKNDKVYTSEEKICKLHFDSNVGRSEDKQFMVVLPFKGNMNLVNLYDMTLRRMLRVRKAVSIR